MPEVVTVDVVVRDRGAKQTLKGVADEAKKTGTSFGDMAKDSKTLSKQLFEMDIAIRKTAQELERTGDTSLVKSIRKQQRELAALVKVRRDVLGISFGGKDDGGGAASGAVKAGAGFGMSFIDSASKAMSSGGTKFVAAVAGAIAVASPFIGASLAAAVLGASGTLGIAGGVAMAARDPRVKAAAADFGKTFMAEFGKANEPFIGPTVAALQNFEAAAVDVAGKLGPEFEGLADHVAPLSRALVEMVRNLLPGFKDGLKAAQNVLAALENVLPEFGEDLSAMFKDMAANPEAAAAAMHDLVTVIGETARGIGFLTKFLSSYYEVLIKVGEVTTGWANDLPDFVKAITPLAAVADYFDQTAAAMEAAMENAPHIETHLEGVAETAAEAAKRLKDLSDAVEDAFSKQMGLDEAIVSWHQGLRDLKDELNDGKRTLSLYTEEGLRNRDAMLDQIETAEAMRQKTFEQTGDLDAANAAYQQNIQTLYDMGRAAGFSRTELDALFAPYINGPRLAITEFQFPGLLAGLAAARELARLLGSNAAAARFNAGDSSGYGGGRASGGYIPAGMTADVAESGTGVERVKMLAGGGAIVQNMDQWSAAGGGGTAMVSRPVVNIRAMPSGNAAFDALIQALWPYILKQVRIDGGDLAAFGAA